MTPGDLTERLSSFEASLIVAKQELETLLQACVETESMRGEYWLRVALTHLFEVYFTVRKSPRGEGGVAVRTEEEIRKRLAKIIDLVTDQQRDAETNLQAGYFRNLAQTARGLCEYDREYQALRWVLGESDE